MFAFSATSSRCFKSVLNPSQQSLKFEVVGFSTKSNAPALVASTALGPEPCPVTTITSVSGFASLM